MLGDDSEKPFPHREAAEHYERRTDAKYDPKEEMLIDDQLIGVLICYWLDVKEDLLTIVKQVLRFSADILVGENNHQ